MRNVAIAAMAAAMLCGCNRETQSKTDERMREAGRQAHEAAYQAQEAAKQAGHELDKAGHEMQRAGKEMRYGWDSATREKHPDRK